MDGIVILGVFVVVAGRVVVARTPPTPNRLFIAFCNHEGRAPPDCFFPLFFFLSTVGDI